MPDYQAIAQSLVSPEAFYNLLGKLSRGFGSKKQAVAALELWNGAESRFIGAAHTFRAPGGTGTGLYLRIYWDPARVATPDLGAVEVAINTAVPVKLIKDDAKAAFKGQRDKKQSYIFSRVGAASSPLSQWFLEKFGVWAVAQQVTAPDDFAENTVAVVVKDGLDHLWAFEA
ncbi:MAG: hypothetical protein LBK95_12890 [Bifidobacteriaceae bacterium]|jgi:hypothetical protein|nr:hypothetical protein [Bifidobacteriaceae bacterium]